MNPYLANPDEIPDGDLYKQDPHYGRYLPRQDDFLVDPQHINSSSEESLNYWSSVINLCTEAKRLYPAPEGGRDVFALGSIIIKSSHLHHEAEIDYEYADANEVKAIAIVKSIIEGPATPKIYFSGKINRRQVLVQERIPGVGLNVAWPYLSDAQRNSFKAQAREILRKLSCVKPPDGCRVRQHVVQDPNILTNGRIRPFEADILFSSNLDNDMSLMHNDFNQSNCIVNDDKIVGLIDWEMAGYFGWKTAGEVHRKVRSPQKEHFVNANISEDMLREILSWNDLYDDATTEC